MAICPKCHTMDKNFFAGKCHACNSGVGFFEQIVHSIAFCLAFGGVIYFAGWLVFG